MPPDAPDLDLLVGRVTGPEGEISSNFEIAPTPIAGQYGATYHLSFPLAVGSHTVEIVGAAGGEPQLMQSIVAEISQVPDEGTWLSPIWLGTGVTPNTEALIGEAFTIGGWHLTPISGPELTRASEIAYFGFVVRPALNEEGAVLLESTVQLKRDGKPFGKPLTVPLGSVANPRRPLYVRQLYRSVRRSRDRSVRVRIYDYRDHLRHRVQTGSCRSRSLSTS